MKAVSENSSPLHVVVLVGSLRLLTRSTRQILDLLKEHLHQCQILFAYLQHANHALDHHVAAVLGTARAALGVAVADALAPNAFLVAVKDVLVAVPVTATHVLEETAAKVLVAAYNARAYSGQAALPVMDSFAPVGLALIALVISSPAQDLTAVCAPGGIATIVRDRTAIRVMVQIATTQQTLAMGIIAPFAKAQIVLVVIRLSARHVSESVV
ncbi:hypothetical protein ONS96_013486 [Cadophora gregata f. sp. sojae]|nr:hypothetical protein ONS96_013486 [Cadophora gregata f. sp. sojae]